MFLNFHLPHYFKKNVRKEINELYWSSAISNFAQSVVTLFEPIFLFVVLHFTVEEVLLFFAVVYGVYIITIPFGGKFASVYGYRHSIALSAPFQVFYWLALLVAVSYPGAAFLAAAILGVYKAFYWPGFHSVMTRYAHSSEMGKAFGAVYAITIVANALGPLLGGLLATRFGLPLAFLLASVLYCISIIPLLTAKEIFVPRIYHFSETLELYKNYPTKFLGYMGFGEELLSLTVWPIFIYIIVASYKDTGILITGASLIGALLALVLGKISDLYTKRILIKIGAFFSALVYLARFIATSFWNVFAVDSLARASKETLFVPLSTLTYLRAEAAHIVPYAVFFEQSLSVGKLSACLIGALLFHLTGSFMVLFILAGGYSLLYMYI